MCNAVIDKEDAHKAIAKLLSKTLFKQCSNWSGLRCGTQYPIEDSVCPRCSHPKSTYSVDIYNRASDCLEAVNKILWHGLKITPLAEGGELISVRISTDDDCDYPISVTKDTLEDAIVAASLIINK